MTPISSTPVNTYLQAVTYRLQMVVHLPTFRLKYLGLLPEDSSLAEKTNRELFSYLFTNPYDLGFSCELANQHLAGKSLFVDVEKTSNSTFSLRGKHADRLSARIQAADAYLQGLFVELDQAKRFKPSWQHVKNGHCLDDITGLLVVEVDEVMDIKLRHGSV